MNEDKIQRPGFAERIIEKYKSSQSNVFLVYGNTRDVYPTEPGEYLPLVDFLVRELIRTKRTRIPKITIIYDPSTGISFDNPLDEQLIERKIGQERLDKLLREARKDMIVALGVLRELTRVEVKVPGEGPQDEPVRKDFAVIIRYGEAVCPPSRGEIMMDSDRLKVITLENWFSDSQFVASSHIVFLITETLSGINERVVDLPYCSAIKIDRPSVEERRSYIEYLMKHEKAEATVPAARIAYSSAGLSLLSIRQIFRQAAFQSQAITPELIFDKTKESIEKELEGYIEFPSLKYGFEKVIGASRLVRKLSELREHLRGDDPDLMPVGILVPGANGVGKTFIYRAFAKECGWVAVILKNIRGQYVGQTERNWERIRSVLEAMGNVMVLYDEADTEIGGRGPQTHDVDRRLFGNILRMMSEAGNRGKIVWIIITARPDRLEPDIKRSGRAGEHLPVFDNEGEEREAFLNHVLTQAGIDMTAFSQDERADFLRLTQVYYPADFEHLLTEVKRRRNLEGGTLTPAMVLHEVKDFIPSDIARQREYQELLAVLECTSRELIPLRYAALSREEAQERVQQIKAMMGMG